MHLHPSLLKGLKELGFTRPTPIQQDAIPPAMEGRDLLACAMTGSGKTAAFLLPVLHALIERPRGTTRCLVLTPTRELAAQILDALNEMAVHTPITAAAIFGGVGMAPQEHAFRTGVDILIATPGRLLDHLKSPYARLGSIEYLILDEADRMLDLGFLPDIRRVLKHVPAKRQTLFFSATIPAPIATLSHEMLHNAVTINLERKSAPAVGITQAVYPVAQELKSALLTELLKRGEMPQALVFMRTKHRANRLAEHLVKAGIKADRIHGNRSQPQRTAALAGFKAGAFQALVATDIAARGIDVEALGHVVNFDVPAAPDDYIHRVGRTARAEATGHAFTFVAPEEEPDLRAIEKRDRPPAATRDDPRIRLFGEGVRQARGADRRTHRGNPGAQGGRPGAGEAEGRGAQRARGCGPRRGGAPPSRGASPYRDDRSPSGRGPRRGR